MSDYLQVLKTAIADAPNDAEAAHLLRTIVQCAAERAPVHALVELGETLVAMRGCELRRAAECN